MPAPDTSVYRVGSSSVGPPGSTRSSVLLAPTRVVVVFRALYGEQGGEGKPSERPPHPPRRGCVGVRDGPFRVFSAGNTWAIIAQGSHQGPATVRWFGSPERAKKEGGGGLGAKRTASLACPAAPLVESLSFEEMSVFVSPLSFLVVGARS